MYAIKYWCCELLSLLNVLGQMYAMDVFFAGEFYDYGLRVFGLVNNHHARNRTDVMAHVFPSMTKCTFKQYGRSGTVQLHDALCVLPLNVVNEKTYIVIWYWFVIWAVCLIVLMIYRLMFISCRLLRPRLIQVNRGTITNRRANKLGRKMDIGNWWVLHILRKNLTDIYYCDILIELAEKFDQRDDNGNQAGAVVEP